MQEVRTKFIEGVVESMRPWAVYCRIPPGTIRAVQNGLNQRVPIGSPVLIAETQDPKTGQIKVTIVGRRKPEST